MLHLSSYPQGWENRAAAAAAALSHKIRYMIVTLLFEHERSAGEISDALGIAPGLSSQHLSYLRVAKILRRRRNKVQLFYSIHPDAAVAISALIEAVELQCKQQLAPT